MTQLDPAPTTDRALAWARIKATVRGHGTISGPSKRPAIKGKRRPSPIAAHLNAQHNTDPARLRAAQHAISDYRDRMHPDAVLRAARKARRTQKGLEVTPK